MKHCKQEFIHTNVAVVGLTLKHAKFIDKGTMGNYVYALGVDVVHYCQRLALLRVNGRNPRHSLERR